MKKATVVTATLCGLILLVTVQSCFLKSANANPYIDYKSVPSPVSPTIAILSPADNKTYASNNLPLSLRVSIDNSSVWIKINRVYYDTSWQETNVTVYEWKYYDMYNLDPSNDDPVISEFSGELNLTEIPEGEQNVSVTVVAEGGYAENAIAYSFDVFGSKMVTFTVDTAPPKVVILSDEKRTYQASVYPLNFTVNEPVSSIAYSLDGADNVTINGNTTLYGLFEGAHNIEVFATDLAGNTGGSEIITFIVNAPEPFPTTFVAAASGVSVALVGFSLLFYYNKKRASRA